MISKVKKELLNHIGDVVSIKYNLGRNKYEEYEAVVKELYDYVFLVECDNVIKSFSYIDVITRVIRIDY
jgi:uncharacterized protein Veg